MENIKEYLTPRLYFAVGAYLITLLAVYVIQYRMYAGAVATVFLYILIYPPLFLVAYFGVGRRRKRRAVRPEAKSKALGVCAVILLAGSAMVAYNLISAGQHQRLATWQIISIVVAAAVIALMERKIVEQDIEEKARAEKAGIPENGEGAGAALIAHFPTRVNYVSMVFALLLFTTIVYLIAASPITVGGARRMLEERGRQNAVFVGHYPPEAESLPDSAGPLGAYSFSGIAGGRVFWVDVATGAILD